MRPAVLAAALAAIACATPGPALRPAGGVQALAPGITVELPPGWSRTEARNELVATREGFGLQSLRAWVTAPRAATETHPFLGPEELAERSAGQIAWRARAARVVDVRPFTVGGAPGYRLELEYLDAEGLRYRWVGVGAVIGDRVCRITFEAPARWYFDRDLPTFERAVASLRAGSPP
jgi:hypothetical protein